MKRHLIGIGGVGMSALATALVKLGDEVTGADRNLKTKNITFLESLGVRCFPDDGSGVDEATDEVIVSTAIEETNAGLLKAKEFGIPVTHRAKALARALGGFRLVAVVGTCGKSTVTAMLGHVLAECGLDPMCVNGANVPGWLGAVRVPSKLPNLKTSKPPFAVAEVDESDKSLVAFKPYAAIVTNASADHYSKAEMDEVFDAFIKDCPGPVIDARGETYAPEDFNAQNASLAIRMAVALGCDESRARAAMSSFPGVERRLQRYFPFSTSTSSLHLLPAVYDDYAHNPEKLRSMWLALKKAHPGALCAIWRPHGYAPLRKMLDELAKMFCEVMAPEDRLLLLPVYDAGGTTDRSISSEDLAERVRGCKGERVKGCVELVGSLDAAYEWTATHRGEFAAVVTCGARDPDLPALACRIAENLV